MYPSPSKKLVYNIQDNRFPPNANFEEIFPIPTNNNNNNNKISLIIDFGSSEFRCGSSMDTSPSLKFKPFSKRNKSSRRVSCGNHSFYEDLGSGRMYTPFKKDIMYNEKCFEELMDYVLYKYGFGDEENSASVKNLDLVLSEQVLCPYFGRAKMSEVLFESYNVNSICYGVDSLFSYFHGGCGGETLSDGLIIRSGNYSTQVIPILDGGPLFEKCQRIPIGGSVVDEYLLKLVEFKYPQFSQSDMLTPFSQCKMSRIQEIKEECCFMSTDYLKDLRRFSSNEGYFHSKTKFIQLPFQTNNPTETVKVVISEEELERRRKEEELKYQKRKERGDRMREEMKKKYEERVKRQNSDLQFFEYLYSLKLNESTKDRYFSELKRINFTESDFMESFEILKKKVKNRISRQKSKKRKRVERVEEEEDIIITEESKTDESKTDNEFEPPKKKQKTMGIEFNEELRSNDPEKWLKQMKHKRNEIEKELLLLQPKVVKVSNKLKINQNTTIAANRSKRKAASSGRLKKITQAILRTDKAMNSEFQKPKRKKRKKTKRGVKKRRKNKNSPWLNEDDDDDEDDGFGRDDNDWNVYRDFDDSLNQDLRKDNEKEIEKKKRKISEYDIAIANCEMKLYKKSLSSQKVNHYVDQYRFLRVWGHDGFKFDTLSAQLREEERYQLALSVERIRAPELIFKPYFIGLKCSGLMGMIERLLKPLKRGQIRRLMSNIYLDGGNMRFRGAKERIFRDLRTRVPIDININLKNSESSEDCWMGMRKFYNLNAQTWSKFSFNKKEYEECGREHYTKKFMLGNSFYKYKFPPKPPKINTSRGLTSNTTTSNANTIIQPPPSYSSLSPSPSSLSSSSSIMSMDPYQLQMNNNNIIPPPPGLENLS